MGPFCPTYTLCVVSVVCMDGVSLVTFGFSNMYIYLIQDKGVPSRKSPIYHELPLT